MEKDSTVSLHPGESLSAVQLLHIEIFRNILGSLNQIDDIFIGTRFKSSLVDVKSYRGLTGTQRLKSTRSLTQV